MICSVPETSIPQLSEITMLQTTSPFSSFTSVTRMLLSTEEWSPRFWVYTSMHAAHLARIPASCCAKVILKPQRPWCKMYHKLLSTLFLVIYES